MPDLGSYAGPVLGAYAVSAVLIVAMVAVSLRQAARARAALAAVEAARETPNG